MKRTMMIFAMMAFAAGCSQEQDGAWEAHDLGLAMIGKAKYVECRRDTGNRADFAACAGTVAGVLDSWCEIYKAEDSKACLVLDDISDAS